MVYSEMVYSGRVKNGARAKRSPHFSRGPIFVRLVRERLLCMLIEGVRVRHQFFSSFKEKEPLMSARGTPILQATIENQRWILTL